MEPEQSNPIVEPVEAEPIAPKARRGRPPKSPIEETAIEGEKKTTPKARTKKAVTDPAQLGKQIKGLHAMAAIVTGIPELMIDEQEGELLANALNAVAEEYGLSISGKTGAAIQLFGACAMIYAPRLLLLKKRIDQQRMAQMNEQPLP